jgi:hypothetical protein
MRIIISRRKRSIKFLFLSIFFLLLLVATIYYLPPTFTLTFLFWSISIVIPFLVVVFLFLFSSLAFLFRSKEHAVIISSFIVICLIFLFLDLNQPIFFVLLAALALVCELLLQTIQRKRQKASIDK